jgi:predicted cupin superfamily sugar epimerase
MQNRRGFLQQATLAGAALAAPSAFAQTSGAQTMTNEMTAEEVRLLLKLQPHPTCGYVRISYIGQMNIPAGALPAPFETGRPVGSALYFMMTAERPVHLHRIRNDQLYHYYMGDPIEVIMLKSGGEIERVTVGPDLRAGQVLQLFIPGNTFHTARILSKRDWFLGASTEWPGVEPQDVEIGKLDELAAKYPSAAADIRAIAASAKG